MSTLASLRAEVARTIAALPEVFRSCSADVLCDVIAPEFTEDDHNRPTKLNPNVTPPPAKWTALVEAMKDPRLSSSDAVKELETAAAALEARIRDADETRESMTHGDDEYGYVHSRPLGTGLVSCGSCGRTLAAEALVSHRKENCAGARRALGTEGVAGRVGGRGRAASPGRRGGSRGVTAQAGQEDDEKGAKGAGCCGGGGGHGHGHGHGRRPRSPTDASDARGGRCVDT